MWDWSEFIVGAVTFSAGMSWWWALDKYFARCYDHRHES